jgi:uncharacterized membrane protein YdjX (TVP38/TMEM64 family)
MMVVNTQKTNSWLSRPVRAGVFLLLLLVLCAPLILGYSTDDGWNLLARHHSAVSRWVEDNYLAAVGLYILTYLVGTSLSLPCAGWLTVGGGLLFGAFASTFYAVFGATAGATTVFLLARTFGGDLLRTKAGTTLDRMEQGFRRNSFSYLLALRLLPLIPFWLVNLVPGLLNVRLRTFVLATMIGIIPGTAMFASLGGGAAAILDRGERPDTLMLFEPEIFIPLAGVALLVLLPVFISRVQNRGHG